ncbi:suppression of tumorigenicity [Trichuris trichiura]|uniref:Protein ST7 homolog n=1 Tax=Trichuris trichiura TaxID=36087 RepID=A0A077ZFP9_TRITR|nr:suppression of tumorigenicity [Trichuris trichiura]
MFSWLRNAISWSWTYLWIIWFSLVLALLYILRVPTMLQELILQAKASARLIKNSYPSECKVWRNPMSLFRGAEYQRFTNMTGREALTYYDMNLSAQDHQNYFTSELDVDKAEYEIMQTAWRERDPAIRLESARKALELNPNCVTAMILLAEEDCETIVEVEQMLRQALRAFEENARKNQTNVLIYIRRRLAMCARRLGKLTEAVKLMRDLIKEFPTSYMTNIHENLIEVLLEMQAYNDAQTVLARLDEFSLPKSATIVYTSALLKVRYVAERFSPDVAAKRGLTPAELSAVEAIHKAVEFNPHVPKYLLEMKSFILPPEHVLKRGDSEAISYAFWHLEHWRRVEGALDLLRCTWEGSMLSTDAFAVDQAIFQHFGSVDRELLPAWHELSTYPKKELPFAILFAAGLCSGLLILLIVLHQYPKALSNFANALLQINANNLLHYLVRSKRSKWSPGLALLKKAQLLH